jgi:phosphorylcholine metabolism protein LicD
MIRAYLRFFRDNRLETWIAHGTLLGWWWNGKKLPWDLDIDTQVSDQTLTYLATNLNSTVYNYVDTANDISIDYLLDVNPYYTERDRGNGMNIIDARWIDVRNGLYIDVTGLSETDQKYPGVWACKNYHHYLTKDLYPLRESTFEGMPAKIPYAYDKILVEEYAETALTLTEYAG